LIETLVTGGILLAISSMTMLWLTSSSALWWTSSTQSHVRARTQEVLSRVTSELRNATRASAASPPNISIPAAPNNTSITCYLPADLDGNGLIVDALGNTEWGVTPIQYVHVPASNQLQRVVGAQVEVLANDVTGVTFVDRAIDASLYQNEVRITVTVQQPTPQGRTVSAISTTTIKLRN